MSEATEPSQNLDDNPHEKDLGESFHAPRMAAISAVKQECQDISNH